MDWPANARQGTRDTPHRNRPHVAFFEFADVFEDFYPHYGVDQRTFATQWVGSGNHLFVSLLQKEVADVTWYEFSLRPQLKEARHEIVGCQVKMVKSSWIHRWLWRAFYLPRCAWRWRNAYRAYATIASYLAPLSWSFVAMMWRDRPDFIFAQSYSSGRFDVLLLLARFLNVPFIAYHAGGQFSQYLGKSLRQWTLPMADLLLVSGRSEREMLLKRYGVSPERVRVVLTPIDTAAYRPMDRMDACDRLGLDWRRRYVLFVGRLDDEIKRISTLVRSFAALNAAHPDVDLLVVGNGRDADRLKKLGDTLVPGRVRFMGWISNIDDKARVYSVADCLVLPSKREGFPTVVGEAMACGTPVVASDVGGIPEIVRNDDTGWLIPPGDRDALVARLTLVLENPSIVAAVGARARSVAERRVSHRAVASALRSCFSHSSL
jgi:glycosyltransferase involved in cell wall biosynthesis